MGRNQILLIDAQQQFEAGAAADFGMMRVVPNSAPLRVGRRADKFRAWASVIVMGIVVFLSTLGLKNGDDRPLLPLASLCTWASAILIGSDILTFEEALNSIN